MNSGQVCLCVKRFYVHKSIYEALREALIKVVKTFKVGNGAEEGTTHGPLQNAMQYERVNSFFADVDREKWSVACGGKNDRTDGYFVNPTIIENPPEKSRIVVEEPFGESHLCHLRYARPSYSCRSYRAPAILGRRRRRCCPRQ